MQGAQWKQTLRPVSMVRRALGIMSPLPMRAVSAPNRAQRHVVRCSELPTPDEVTTLPIRASATTVKMIGGGSFRAKPRASKHGMLSLKHDDEEICSVCRLIYILYQCGCVDMIYHITSKSDTRHSVTPFRPRNARET